MRSPLTILAIAGALCGNLVAAEFQGADAVLKRIAAQRERFAKAEKAASPAGELAKKVKAFETESDSLPPDEAAARWLALFDAYTVLPMQGALDAPATFYSGEQMSVQTLIMALPRPEAWDALAAAIEGRAGQGKELRTGGLRLLLAVLRGDVEGRQTALAGLQKAVENKDTLEEYERGSLLRSLEERGRELEAGSATARDRLTAFETELTKRENKAEEYQYSQSISVPDLVRLAGKEAAAPLITRAMRLEPVSVEGAATRKLAAQIALKEIATIKQPPWDLVEGVEDLQLYEALTKQFPKPGDGTTRGESDVVYLLGLIASNRKADAVNFASAAAGRMKLLLWYGVSGSVLDRMQREGSGRKVVAFLSEILSRDPTLPYWDLFLTLSARESQSGAALHLLRETVKKPGLSQELRAEMQRHLYQALLAADEVDAGIQVLRDIVRAGPDAGKTLSEETANDLARAGIAITPALKQSIEAKSSNQRDSGLTAHAKLAMNLAKLGRLLGRPELVKEGVDAALASVASFPPSEAYDRQEVIDDFVEMLLDLGRGPEAEELVAHLLEAYLPEVGRRDGTTQLPALLALIYHRTERDTDVLRVFDGSPLWGVPDLARLTGSRCGETLLLQIAAEALAATGRNEEARKVARRIVQENPWYDPAYALLLRLGGSDLEAYLDRTFRFDRFEERPLIWKATLQYNAGRIEDAEKTIREAIAIDPSDEHGRKGNRLRAYAVLADILEKKGDAAQAKLMRSAVAAIRLSEEADDWWEAGLHAHSARLSEEALALFADAYCIQWHLALRYGELGDSAKAEEHYRRAFELMPGSLGRGANHCFGCEGTFAGRHVQDCAERVFATLVEKEPDRPQVFYSFGALRATQDRYDEAADLYRKAVKLDPDYLDAWKDLGDISDMVNLSSTEREAAAFALLRLDPTGSHSALRVSDVTDLRKLWRMTCAALKAIPAHERGGIYPLAAATAEMEKQGRTVNFDFSIDAGPFRRSSGSRVELRQRYLDHPAVASAAAILEQVARLNGK